MPQQLSAKYFLIAGGTGTGKTTLARKISIKTQCSIISTDNIRNVLRTKYEHDTDVYGLLKSSYLLEGTYSGIFDADLLKYRFDHQARVVCQHGLTKLNSGLKIIEGIHLIPEHIPDLVLAKSRIYVIRPPDERSHIDRLVKRCNRDDERAQRYQENYKKIRVLSEYIVDCWARFECFDIKFLDTQINGRDLVSFPI